MDNQEFITGTDKLEFRQIVLGHLRKILDLSLKIHNPDLIIAYTKTYRDSILTLSDILLPFYDKEMNEVYEQYEKDYKQIFEDTKNIDKQTSLVNKTSRKLFRNLNLLMKRVDYLKGTVYGEERESTEIVEVDK